MATTYRDDKVAETEAFIPGPEEHPTSRKRLTIFKTAIALSILAAAILGFITSSAYSYITHLPPAKLHCGKSVEEAQALGCKFDLLAAGWVPAPCIDHASDQEYREWILNANRRLGPFPYFSDEKLTVAIPGLDALSRHNGTIYTTKEEHLGHCAQLARRAHRAAISGDRRMGLNVDTDETGVISSMHIAHCVKILWTQATEDEHNTAKKVMFTKFSINFLTCGGK